MDLLKKTWTWTWDRSQKGQRWLEFKIKSTGRGRYGRVLKMARKPTSEEYSKTLIITAIGILLIGGMGFGILLLWDFFPDLVEWAFGL